MASVWLLSSWAKMDCSRERVAAVLLPFCCFLTTAVLLYWDIIEWYIWLIWLEKKRQGTFCYFTTNDDDDDTHSMAQPPLFFQLISFFIFYRSNVWCFQLSSSDWLTQPWTLRYTFLFMEWIYFAHTLVLFLNSRFNSPFLDLIWLLTTNSCTDLPIIHKQCNNAY